MSKAVEGPVESVPSDAMAVAGFTEQIAKEEATIRRQLSSRAFWYAAVYSAITLIMACCIKDWHVQVVLIASNVLGPMAMFGVTVRSAWLDKKQSDEPNLDTVAKIANLLKEIKQL